MRNKMMVLASIVAVLVAGLAADAAAQMPPVSKSLRGRGAVGPDGTLACVIVVSSEDDDWDEATKRTHGSLPLRGCMLAAPDKQGTFYAEPSGGKCAPDQKACVVVVSSEDEDWIYATKSKPTGAGCVVVLTPVPGSDDPGIYEAVGIDGARVYILDEDDRIARAGDKDEPPDVRESVGIDAARVYILDDDDQWILKLGDPADPAEIREAVGIDGARVYILDEDDRI